MTKREREKDVAAELRQAIAQARKGGLSIYRLAKLSGVRLSGCQLIAAGKTIPRLDTAEKLAKAIGYTLTLHHNKGIT
ncbi:MAG: helix-turn-helix transcriptional regulator [Phycisphaeraceae bacterium]|nr:helix-turn-helix transcriptional regulator [Phycisphaeraceae bacterium]